MAERTRGSSIEWVRIGDMTVCPQAQREYRPAHTAHIAANFRLEAMGLPVLSRRDGRYYVVDGQHRIAALEFNGFTDDDVIECEVYDGMTEADEAEMYLLLNDSRRATAFDRFRVGVTAGRFEETQIEKAVHSLELKIANRNEPGCIGAVQSLRFAFDLGGFPLLTRTLRLLSDSFDRDRDAFDPHLIKGAALVCQRYNGTLDEDAAVKRLRSLPGPSALQRRAVALQLKTGHTRHDCAAAAMVDAINEGQRGASRLESWWR